MFKPRHMVLIVAILVAGAVTWNVNAQREKAEGDQPYAPTKLEWLALTLNLNQPEGGEIQIQFRPHREKKNTIQAQVIHSPVAKDQQVQAHVIIAERSVRRISRQYGWDWVAVDVQIAEFNTGFVQ